MIQNITLFFLFFVLGSSLFAQNTATDNETALELYPFDSKVFNLKTLQYSASKNEVSESFKTKSKYAVRYKGLTVDKLAYQGMIFEALTDNSLLLRNLETQAVKALPNKEKGLPVQGRSLLLEAMNGIIYIKPLKADNGYMVYKYDKTGKELFGVQITHSEFVQHNELTYHLPYLGYITHTSSNVVFASYVDRIPKTVVLNTDDGSLSKFDFSSVGIIRDAQTDMDIHGFVQLNKTNSSIKVTYITDNFDCQKPYFKDITHIETLILDNTLVLVAYNGRSPEVHLLALDLSTKTLKWEADVAAFGKDATSAYFNTLWLGSYDGKIILEGYETQGKSLQIFDSADGKRLWKSF
jgi:hypothetical protein